MRDIEILGEVVSILENASLRYWLGRGRFLHLAIHKTFGDHDSDIDLHVFREDEQTLRGVLPTFQRHGYQVTDGISMHKISLEKGSVAVEFPFLDLDPTGKGVRYHKTMF